MNFAVLWKRPAILSIRQIIDKTTNPDRVIAAVREIGRELRDDPPSKGESRTPGQRILFAPPLAAIFSVQWRLNQVIVGRVWEFAEHNAL